MGLLPLPRQKYTNKNERFQKKIKEDFYKKHIVYSVIKQGTRESIFLKRLWMHGKTEKVRISHKAPARPPTCWISHGQYLPPEWGTCYSS